jgi:hypothetical protein
MAPSGSSDFPWLLWTLIGCAGWVVLMVAIGEPIGLLATPVGGPIGGWLVGGAIYLLAGAVTRR